ncbi:hypothetical protein [Exiguobacterium sp. NG55]|uniref:hypothetical protein n=1 Tax=Exiguobacterium sp. NG55 TaxID=375477 RepID=UPI0004DEE660|nr:hypothetical protein [Exiguobacterium sp. NG55]
MIRMKSKRRNFQMMAVVMIFSALLVGCAEEKAEEQDPMKQFEKVTADLRKEQEKNEEKTKNQPIELTTEAFTKYIEQIDGSDFMKTIELKDGVANIEYYSSFEDYMEEHPNTSFNSSHYVNTVIERDQILIGETVEMLRYFPEMKSIRIFLPNLMENYTVEVERNRLNELLGMDVTEPRGDSQWREEFTMPYIIKAQGRERFFETFVTVDRTST